jgi:hypothetical protein
MFNPGRIINTGQAYADQATSVLSKGAQQVDQSAQRVTQSAEQAAQSAQRAAQQSAQAAQRAVQTTAQTVEQGARDVRAQLPSAVVADADRRAQERIEQNRKAMLYTGIALILLGGATYYVVRKK